MNVGYAVKLLASFLVLLLATRVLTGRGLRQVMDERDWRLAWWALAGTCAVDCLSFTMPLFFLVLAAWSIFLGHWFSEQGKVRGRVVAYALLVTVLGPMFLDLRNVGPIQYLLQLTPYRLIAIVLLGPEAMHLLGRKHRAPTPGWLRTADLATYGFAAFWIARLYGGFSMSIIGRAVMELALDTLLPYFVMSRACSDASLRRRVLSVVLLGACFQGVVGMAETASKHYFFAQLQWLYQSTWFQAVNLMRGSFLRAEGAFLGPLALGVLEMFALALWVLLRPVEARKSYAVVGLACAGGLIATFGRGPWLCGALVFVGLAPLKRWGGTRFLAMAVVAGIGLGAFIASGAGEELIAMVGHIGGGGEDGDFNVRYRHELLDTSLALLRQSPVIGVPNFTQYMENLRQGEGIIDLVNTYLIVALNVGLLGLALWLVPFGIVLFRLAARQRAGDPVLGRESAAWLMLAIATMAVVFTVSPVSVIQPLMVWAVAIGLGILADGTGEPVAPATSRPGAVLQSART